MGFVKGLQQVACTRCAACLTPPDAGSSVVHATSARCRCRPGKKHRRPRASADCVRIARQVRYACADCGGGLRISGQMHMMALPGLQTLDKDRFEKAGRGAGVRHRRWHARHMRQSDGRCGVALDCADLPTIGRQRNALLVVAGDHCTDQVCVTRPSSGSGGSDQGIDVGPSFAIQRQPDGLRRMPKDIAEELAGLGVQRAHVRCWGRGAWRVDATLLPRAAADPTHCTMRHAARVCMRRRAGAHPHPLLRLPHHGGGLSVDRAMPRCASSSARRAPRACRMEW